MKKLPPPTFNVHEVFNSCANSKKDKELTARLLLSNDLIVAAENQYRELGQEARLFEIPQMEDIEGKITSAEMCDLYQGTFSKKGSKNRHFYDTLKLSAPYGVCPLCCQRIVTTLDHYLPKAKYALFAVTPLNLVPACTDCNKSKLDSTALSISDQTFHPYFDDVSSEIWIGAKVMETDVPSVIFFTLPPADWSIEKQLRLKKHFEIFGLCELYTVQASVEMINIHYALHIYAQSGDSKSVKNYLDLEASSRTIADKNSWSAALYRALSESDWFCNIGFSKLRLNL